MRLTSRLLMKSTNLALQMDFNANTIQVFQSSDNAPLAKATEPLANDLSGSGQLHFGANKNPTSPGTDVLRSGFQESGILEGVVYGGIFVEDSASGTVTLS
ncbi:hypothetical protein PtrV1_02030 [Pyrenophora tritici-repentis]|uniref:Glycoside hydrolase 131 catalytic N-terminal domain-containing protein n=1 Tax=Pyrenophora tritici-repentis (strain Pt-1C-BFP) TaxID=426418 RepID=B2VWV9_PYRTR|nr:uncharacterized protein PTRG_01671 [Pyrenophora tritici-repentis Pt-1C-BFP]KAA8626350.1 hypothetical protein PtrV1_02030 [Pyrenophora tritici-repentis]EDU41109.1 predicted protein [Pyrenophora tritici-repentis Pt-1C-BFP]KAF7454765.1 hypothetical protein A1F99_020230 [Pyrenophora tritici-repentis]KAI0569713.1 hypothetical protein Alg215_11477 [Pyrenophora tritici-repentis]PZD24648.1 hypothetical protein A1F96_09155 [Pyrenophora tritici-repentis]